MSSDSTATTTRKWHDVKWKLATASAVGGLVLGMIMAVGDAGEAEARADQIVKDAKKERRAILGSAGEEKDTLSADVEALRKDRTSLTAQVNKLRADLGTLKRQKATSTFEGSGIFMVGTDVRPGTYRASASPGCYYAVLRKLDGSLDAIISNNNVDGPVVVEIPSSAKAIEVNNCSMFKRAG